MTVRPLDWGNGGGGRLAEGAVAFGVWFESASSTATAGFSAAAPLCSLLPRHPPAASCTRTCSSCVGSTATATACGTTATAATPFGDGGGLKAGISSTCLRNLTLPLPAQTGHSGGRGFVWTERFGAGGFGWTGHFGGGDFWTRHFGGGAVWTGHLNGGMCCGCGSACLCCHGSCVGRSVPSSGSFWFLAATAASHMV